MNNFNLGIRPTILSIFSLIVFITLFITLGLQYYFSQKMALESIQENMEKTAFSTSNRINNIDNSINNILTVSELLTETSHKPKELLNHSLTNKFTSFMSGYSFIYAMYIGYENGDFYEIINLNIDPSLRAKYKTTTDEKWLLLKVSKDGNKRIKKSHFLNEKLEVIRETQELSSYNPTLRPWYKKAFSSSNIIKTKPYQFSNFDSLGVTYAKKIQNSKHIMGIDVSLKTLSSLLKSEIKTKGTLSYLINQTSNKLIASNSDTQISHDKIDEIIQKAQTTKSTIKYNDTKYFISNTILDSKLDLKNQLIIFTPKNKMMEPYNEKLQYAIVLNLLVMLLLSPIMFYLTKLVSRPIHALEQENKKIEQRRFDDVRHVNTKISELSALSNSLVSMSISIKEYEEAQVKLMDSFIEVIASAIDKKSEYTGGHGKRVPLITMMLAQKASDIQEGVFKYFVLKDKDAVRELKIAALLHDCGKITTPEYVVDKSTKLETIYNRLHEVRTRFEVVHRDLEILYYQKLQKGENKEQLQNWLDTEHEKLQKEFEFVAQCNIGGEFMSDDKVQKIKEISNRVWHKKFDDRLGLSQDELNRLTQENDSDVEYILADKYNHIIQRTRYFQEEYEADGFKGEVPQHLYNLGEVYNLTVKKGTLTYEERFKINEHIIMTIKMLEQLPFPSHLKKVPEYAGAHHETLIGTGYPKQLTKEDMSVPARIMAIADVFEALTASDRPYKEAKTLSESIKILGFMVKDQHIDKDLFELFLTSGVYKEYAKEYLKPEQIDEVDIQSYLQ